MSDIVTFLTARYDEAEAFATQLQDNGDHDAILLKLLGGPAAEVGAPFGVTLSLARFLKHLGPARVLADVAAKRAIIALLTPEPREPLSDAEMHEAWNHPAYEYDKTEGQRKAWDRADEPPDGDGWERNVDAGRGGWDRLDFTEESYWRRLRPDGPRAPYVPRELCLLAAVYADHPDYDENWRP